MQNVVQIMSQDKFLEQAEFQSGVMYLTPVYFTPFI